MSLFTQSITICKGYAAEVKAHDQRLRLRAQSLSSAQPEEPKDAVTADTAEPRSEKQPPAYTDVVDRTMTPQPLPLPIIIPQRRPKSKHRGFMRAYAPSLAQYKGIDQDTFLAFLDKLNDSALGNHTFRVINGTAIAASFAPEGITMAAAMGVWAISAAALDMQGRYSRNTYLGKANEEIFHPKKLHCTVVTFKPGLPNSPVLDENLHAITSDKASSMSKTTTNSQSTKPKKGKLRTSDTITKGELEMPQAADLVYVPTKTDVDSATSRKEERFANSKSRIRAVEEYRDRRAQAMYVGTYGQDSSLAISDAANPSNFASKYSDPNHPIHQKGPRAAWKSRKEDHDYTLDAKEDSSSDQTTKTKSDRTTRMVQKFSESILYLMITEMPE